MLITGCIVNFELHLPTVNGFGAAEDVENSWLVVLIERVLQEVRDEARFANRAIPNEHALEFHVFRRNKRRRRLRLRIRSRRRKSIYLKVNWRKCRSDSAINIFFVHTFYHCGWIFLLDPLIIFITRFFTNLFSVRLG